MVALDGDLEPIASDLAQLFVQGCKALLPCLAQGVLRCRQLPEEVRPVAKRRVKLFDEREVPLAIGLDLLEALASQLALVTQQILRVIEARLRSQLLLHRQ